LIKLFKKLLILSCLQGSLFGSHGFQGSVDPHYSPYVGKDAILSLHESVEVLSEFSQKDLENPPRGLKPSFYRFLDCVLFWDPLCYAETTLQHEVFGHGYRIRSLKDAEVEGYSFNLPPPFGSGSGATSFSTGSKITLGEFQAIGIAGLEAEEILSQEIKKKFIKKGKIPRKLSSLYVIARYSPLNYALVPFEPKQSYQEYIASGHDIEGYLATLTMLYPNQAMSVAALVKNLAWNLLDPMTFYQIAGNFYYIFTGKDMNVPMIPLAKDLSYLPNVSVKLAPYGLETYVENYFLYKDSLVFLYVKAGRFHPGDLYYGMGLEGDNLYGYKQFTIGCRVDAWMQPNFLFNWSLQNVLDSSYPEDPFEVSFQKIPGGSFALVGKYGFFENKISFFADLGYKSKGYLPGYPLGSSPITRVGFSAEF
jgi:hypothetical protein